jgi:hypothetical protein
MNVIERALIKFVRRLPADRMKQGGAPPSASLAPLVWVSLESEGQASNIKADNKIRNQSGSEDTSTGNEAVVGPQQSW